MLYSSYRGAGGTFRGKTWKLPNGYWRSCNHNGQQCTFKIWNEALRFADKGKPLSDNKKITIQEGRVKSYYMPELRRREMAELAARLVKNGYKAEVGGPNLRTDASEKYVRSLRTMYRDSEGVRKGAGWSHGSKAMGSS